MPAATGAPQPQPRPHQRASDGVAVATANAPVRAAAAAIFRAEFSMRHSFLRTESHDWKRRSANTVPRQDHRQGSIVDCVGMRASAWNAARFEIKVTRTHLPNFLQEKAAMWMFAISRSSAHDLQGPALSRRVRHRSLARPDGVLVCWKRLWNTPGPMNISSSALTTATAKAAVSVLSSTLSNARSLPPINSVASQLTTVTAKLAANSKTSHQNKRTLLFMSARSRLKQPCCGPQYARSCMVARDPGAASF